MNFAPTLRAASISLLVLWAAGAADAQAPTSPVQTQAQREEATKARAKQLFETAVADFDASRYDAALAGFQEAFRIRPHPLVRVNMANCYDKLGKPLQAIFHFEQFLSADVGSAEQRQEVTAAVARLKKQVGTVLLRVTPDGATVIIDSGDQRRSPLLEGVPLPVGRHTLSVELEGYRSIHRGFNIEGGTTFELNVALEPKTEGPVGVPSPILSVTPTQGAAEPAAPSEAQEPQAAAAVPIPAAEPAAPEPAEATEPEPETARGLPSSVWVLGGLSAGLAVAGTITGILALGAESDFEQQVDTYKARRAPGSTTSVAKQQAAYDSAVAFADHANALALTTDILFGAAIAGAAITTVLVVMHLNKPDDAEVSASFTRESAGLRLRTTF